MYERFTDRARKVMQLANQEAQRFNHPMIHPEHVLLGLLKEGCGIAANVLKSLGLDLRVIRLETERVLQYGDGTVIEMGKLPHTETTKALVEAAIAETKSLNHSYVGTEHLLLGFLATAGDDWAEPLSRLGLTVEKVREETLLLIGQSDGERTWEVFVKALKAEPNPASIKFSIRRRIADHEIEYSAPTMEGVIALMRASGYEDEMPVPDAVKDESEVVKCCLCSADSVGYADGEPYCAKCYQTRPSILEKP